jgi:acetyltransferase-like isoleucine patch superfamily enzyme
MKGIAMLSIYELLFKIKRKVYSVILYNIYRCSFKSFGVKSSIYKPDLIQGINYISIGSHSHMQPGAWLLALKNDDSEPILNICNNVYIGRYAHIVSVRDVTICDDVLIADKVYISDNIHQYKDVCTPIKNQPVVFKKQVIIGRGAWLGENVCVIGACVGKNSVIAANSVVTKDIPDYCVAAGIPAKVIKKYNFTHNEWERV